MRSSSNPDGTRSKRSPKRFASIPYPLDPMRYEWLIRLLGRFEGPLLLDIWRVDFPAIDWLPLQTMGPRHKGSNPLSI
jgi:hypothetical protein